MRKLLVAILLIFSGILNLNAQTNNSGSFDFNRSPRIGFGYQIQEFQLLNQNLASDCNCDENAPLKDRSLQGYYFSVQVPVKTKWTIGFDLGYSNGRTMNDLKQYTNGDFILAKMEANYLFSKNVESKIRPYLTAAAQYYSRPNQNFQGLPLGLGLSARINNSAYLNLQTAYDFGLGEDLAQSLITGVSLRFPLAKSKAAQKPADKKNQVVVLKPVEKTQQETMQQVAQPTAIAQNPVVKPETPTTAITQNPLAKPETQAVVPATPTAKIADKKSTATELYKVIYFNTNKALLNRPGSLITLKEVVDFMKLYPQTKAHLAGHTDLRASIEYNIQLSKKRVNAVYQFLINAGISPDRISVNYFGKSKPASTNPTEDAMLLNRRTEIWVK